MRFASLLLICLLLSLGLLACNQAVSTEDSSPAPDLSQASPLPLPSPTQEVIAAAAADSPYPPEMILDGEFNYSIFCAACHGADAAGLENLGSNLLDNEFIRTQDDAALLAYVIAGRPADDPQNQSGVEMPPRGGYPILKDEQILTIIAYLRALQG